MPVENECDEIRDLKDELYRLHPPDHLIEHTKALMHKENNKFWEEQNEEKQLAMKFVFLSLFLTASLLVWLNLRQKKK